MASTLMVNNHQLVQQVKKWGEQRLAHGYILVLFATRGGHQLLGMCLADISCHEPSKLAWTGWTNCILEVETMWDPHMHHVVHI